MKKKIHYEEPKMPESLRKLMEIGDKDSTIKRRRPTQASKTNKSASKTNKSASKTNKSASKTNRSGSKSTKNANSTNRLSYESNSRDRLKKFNNKAKRIGFSTGEVQVDTSKKTGLRSQKNKKISSNIKRDNKPRSGKSSLGKANLKSSKKTKRVSRKVSRRPISLRKLPSTLLYGLSIFISFLISGGDHDKYIRLDQRERLDKRFYKLLPVAFVGLTLVIMLSVLVHRDQDRSIAENRELEKKPKFTISSFITGKYASKQASYMSDQFPNRTGFIKTKANLDRLMGKKEINGVYLASKGYLMEGFKAEKESITKAKVDAINKFASSNKALKVSMMLVPNKVDIYNHLMPRNAPVDSQADYIKSVASKLSKRVRLVDVESTFDKLKNSEELYYKTDHHWTSDGAFYAYTDLCKALNIQATSQTNFNRSQASDSFMGSLYYKAGAEIGGPDDIYLYLSQDNAPVITKYYDTKKKVASVYDSSKLSGRDQYEVFTGGNHSQIKIRTNVETDRKLLLIKDSYANAMIPFLATTFSEINVVDMRYFTGSLSDVINNNEVTDVLFLYNVNTFNSDSSILSINE